jgi:hypothetical protein
MRIRDITAICVVAALGTYASISQANPDDTGHRWTPRQPSNVYWQTPNWPGFNQPPAYNAPQPPPPPPRYGNTNQAAPVAPPVPVRRPPPRPNNYPAPYATNPNMVPGQPGVYSGYAPPPQPRGPYYGQYNGPYNGPYYGPDNGASAFNTPGYHRYRNNGWDNNRFWGRSGPSTWMNPNKNNMERGWDDMINAPSRMGEMPGGWTAPEVSIPNPVDMGDQMQDNIKDLPEQIRDMDVGND